MSHKIFKCFRQIHTGKSKKFPNSSEIPIYYPGFYQANEPLGKPDANNPSVYNIPGPTNSLYEYPLLLSSGNVDDYILHGNTEMQKIHCELLQTGELEGFIIQCSGCNQVSSGLKYFLPTELAKSNFKTANRLFMVSRSWETLFFATAYANMADGVFIAPCRTNDYEVPEPQSFHEYLLEYITLTIDSTSFDGKPSMWEEYWRDLSSKCTTFYSDNNQFEKSAFVEIITLLGEYNGLWKINPAKLSDKGQSNYFPNSIKRRTEEAVRLFSISHNYHWIYITALLQITLYNIFVKWQYRNKNSCDLVKVDF